MNRTRIVLAAFLAPWAAPISIVLGATIMAGEWPFHYELPLLVMVSVVFSYAGLFLFGFPIMYGLRRFGLINVFTVSVAGALLGLIVFGAFLILFSLALGSPVKIQALFSDSLWGLGLGFVVSLSYAKIAGLTWR
ncbi:hypothetical protein V8G57_09020 [Collimonas sp. H4R21]|uniref:Uncharacterized protein n=1 Tax=Collimonas rhizosphaerae TaxID=3126357 RepID=A0ABU9PU32_9BURK